jgi:NAD-dependent SIR2 family protein deacetylase
MFGESIDNHIKHAAEEAIDNAGKLLVVGTSLATYSAWRLAKRAQDRGMPIAIISMGGIRGEDKFFAGMDPNQKGEQGVRVALSTDDLLPALLSALRNDVAPSEAPTQASLQASFGNRGVFKDMLS